jgi:hypothetical protein
MATNSTNSGNLTNITNSQLGNVLGDLTKVSLALNPNSKLANVAKIMVNQMQTMQPQEIMPSSLVAAAQQYSGDVSPAVMTGLANFLYNAYRGYNAMNQQKQLNQIVQSDLEQQQKDSDAEDLEKQRQKYLQMLDRAADAAVSAVNKFTTPIGIGIVDRFKGGTPKIANLPAVTQAISLIKNAQNKATELIINANSVLEMKMALQQFQNDVDNIIADAHNTINPNTSKGSGSDKNS